MVKVLYFASIREAVGTGGETVALEDGIDTVAALRDQLAARGAPWDVLSRTRNLRAAVNQTLCGFDAALSDGDEVAFFPPVTGG